MKLFAFRLGIGLVALTISLAATGVWRQYHPLSLEQLSADHFWYDGQTVRVHAILDLNDVLNARSNGRSREYMSVSSCPWTKCGALIRLDQDLSAFGLHTYSSDSVDGEASAPQSVRFAEVEISGEVELNEGSGPNCGPRFIIEHAKIEKVIANYQFESLEAGLVWLKKNSR